MNLHQLAKFISKYEKGKKEVSIAQIKEVVKILSVAVYLDDDIYKKLLASGKRHANSTIFKDIEF